MQDRQGQTIPEFPRPVRGPYNTACWWAYFLCAKLVKDVNQTMYSRLWRVYRAKNSGDVGISLLDVERINII